MDTKQIQIDSITADELVDRISEEVTKQLDDEKQRREATDDPRYISPLEVAAIFGVSVTTIYNWEYRGIIKGYRIGGRKRYLKDEILNTPTVVKPSE